MTTHVKLSNICLDENIINQVKSYNKQRKIDQFELSKLPKGFPLNRMKNIMELTPNKFLELLEIEPIYLKLNLDNKYEIQNGRHRIARAIIEGYSTICAKIILF